LIDGGTQRSEYPGRRSVAAPHQRHSTFNFIFISMESSAMVHRLKIPPASEPISLGELKGYLRIADTVDDALLTMIIAGARQRAEEYTGRALINQTWVLTLEGFADQRQIELPRSPLQSVTAVRTYDGKNNASVFSADNYWVDVSGGRLALNAEAQWPADLRPAGGVEVEYVAGYGTTAGPVPEAIRIGILLLAKFMYVDKSRLLESQTSVGLVELSRDPISVPIKNLWDAYRLLRI
jgi:uncharacterized phiE125 gp8 family phage protein